MFVRGAPVTITGLVGRPELNGRAGTTLSFDGGRYGIKIQAQGMEPAAKLSVKPSNLEPRLDVEPADLDFADPHGSLMRCSPEQLARLLQQHGANPDVSGLIMALVSSLSLPEQAGFPAQWSRGGVDNVVEFMRAAGHRAVVEAMLAHPEEDRISAVGIHVLLFHLVAEVERELGGSAMPAVLAVGGAAAVAGAMAAHPSNESLLTAGCMVLKTMTSNDARGWGEVGPTACKRSVLQGGGVAALVRAMAAFPAAAALQEPAASGLAHMVAGYPDACAAAVAAGAAAACVGGMRASVASATAQKKLCMLLVNLMQGAPDLPAAARAIADAGGPAAVCDALRMHVGEKPLFTSACGVLVNLAGGGQHAATQRAGAPAVLRAACDRDPWFARQELAKRYLLLGDPSVGPGF